MDDDNNRHFFIFYLRPGTIRLPGLGPVPRRIADAMMKMTRYTTLQPLLGEHSRAVLGDLGFEAAEIERLVADGVVMETP